MTNINNLQEKLDVLRAQQPSQRLSSEIELLKIDTNLVIARELHTLCNLMAWGAPEDILPRIPAEAGKMAREHEEMVEPYTFIADEIAKTQKEYRGGCIHKDDCELCGPDHQPQSCGGVLCPEYKIAVVWVKNDHQL